ncbi:hypothetical protein [Granulicoccus phenolivorans]|uniref:hypothetical protein n=1 Tax=Granulicoccus phenolivorans TaxID=266854 RepID=UPI001FE1231E|nr:hypothetical protein [Granulicoccus phenolivorans]
MPEPEDVPEPLEDVLELLEGELELLDVDPDRRDELLVADGLGADDVDEEPVLGAAELVAAAGPAEVSALTACREVR